MDPKELERILALQNEEERSRELYNLMFKRKKDYVTERGLDISNRGDADFPTAVEMASKEFDENYLVPITTEYGDFADKTLDLIGFLPFEPEPAPPVNIPTAVEPDIFTPLRPQTYVAEGPVKELEQTRQAVQTRIDFDTIESTFVDEGIDANEAKTLRDALEIAYSRTQISNPNKNPKDVLEQVISEVQELPKTLGLEGDVLQEDLGEKGESAWTDIFKTQFVEGKVPNLTQAQMAYYNTVNDATRKKIADDVREELSKKQKDILVLANGEEISPEDLQAENETRAIGKRSPLSASPQKRDYTEEEIQKEITNRQTKEAPEFWWTDPTKRSDVLADPEKYYDKGWFSTTTPYGGTVETPGGYLLRMGLSPANAVAGAVVEYLGVPLMEVIRGDEAEDVDELRRADREKNSPLYEDHPILLNIAENRGFLGETLNMANLGVGDPTAMAVVGLAADILDPTYAMLGSAIKAPKLAAKAAKASKAVTGEYKLGKALAMGAKLGAYNILDDFNVFGIIDKATGKVISKSLDPGDLRIAFVKPVREEIKAGTLAGKTDAEQKIIDNLTRDVDHLVELNSKTPVGSLRDTTNIARAIRTVSATDPKLLPRLVKVVAEDTSNLPQFEKVVKALEPDDFNKVIEVLEDQAALSFIYERTKDLRLPNDSVMLTPNTFARKDKATEILATAKKNMPFLDELAKITKVEGSVLKFKEVLPLSNPDTKKIIDDIVAKVKELDSVGLLPMGFRAKISDSFLQGFISNADLRTIIGAEVDRVAAASKGTIEASDIERLVPSLRQEYLDPLETRSFGSTLWREWSGINDPEKIQVASIPQKKLIQSITAEASNADRTLRREVNELLKGKNLEKYGLKKKPANKEEALGIAIIGSVAERSAKDTTDIIMNIINRLFFEERTTENFFSNVLGYSNSSNSKLLKQKVYDDFVENVLAATEKLNDNPTRFWNLVGGSIKRYRELLQDPDNLVKGIKTDNITMIDKVPVELQIGAFYRSELQRIYNRVIDNLVAVSKTDLKDPFERAARYFEGKKSPTNNILRRLVENKIRNNNVHPTLVVIEELIEVIPDSLVTRSRKKVKDALNEIHKLLAKGGEFRSGYITETLDTILEQWRFDKVLNNAISKAPERLNNVAEQIALSNKIRSSNIDPTEIKGLLNDIFSGENEELVRAVIGTDVYDSVAKNLDKGALAGFERELIKATSDGKYIKVAKKLYNFIQNLRYTLLLGLRSRFHGANFITGAPIAYSTTGKIANPFATSKEIGLNYIMNGYVNSKSPAYNKIAVTDPAGRSYTYGEVYDAVINSGVRSQYSFLQNVISKEELIAYVRSGQAGAFKTLGPDGKNKVADSIEYLLDLYYKAAEKPRNFADMSDLSFRLGIAHSALKEGRSLDEAVELAKRSMYDYGNMTKRERQLAAHYFIFYAFARENFINLIKSIAAIGDGDLSKIKRYINIMKSDRSAELLGEELGDYSMPPEVFFPDYARSRTILGKIEGAKKDTYIAGPDIPPLTAINQLASVLSGDYESIFKSFVHPNFDFLLEARPDYTDYSKIQKEHLKASTIIAGDDPTAIASYWNMILGGDQIVPIQTIDNAGNVIYEFRLSPEQEQRYRNINKFFNYTGISSPIRDYKRTAKYAEDLGSPAAAAYMAGAMTPIEIARPGQQEIYNLQSRLSEINKAIKRIESQNK